MTTSTTIRVTPDNRDRLNNLAAELGFTSIDQVIGYLIAEDWKTRAIADADRLREEHPEGWRNQLAAMRQWDLTLLDGLHGDAA